MFKVWILVVLLQVLITNVNRLLDLSQRIFFDLKPKMSRTNSISRIKRLIRNGESRLLPRREGGIRTKAVIWSTHFIYRVYILDIIQTAGLLSVCCLSSSPFKTVGKIIQPFVLFWSILSAKNFVALWKTSKLIHYLLNTKERRNGFIVVLGFCSELFARFIEGFHAVREYNLALVRLSRIWSVFKIWSLAQMVRIARKFKPSLGKLALSLLLSFVNFFLKFVIFI